MDKLDILKEMFPQVPTKNLIKNILEAEEMAETHRRKTEYTQYFGDNKNINYIGYDNAKGY